MKFSASLFVIAALCLASAFTIDQEHVDTDGEKIFFATLFIVVGLIVGFFGIQIFKPTLFLFAFMGTATSVIQILGPHMDNETHLYSIAGCCGIAVGISAVSFVSCGLMLLGLFAGVLLAGVAYLVCLHYISEDNNTLLYCVVAVAGALGVFIGSRATRLIIIVITSMCGAYFVVSGIDLVADRELDVENLKDKEIGDVGWILLASWVVLSALGFFYQRRSKSNPKELEKTKNKKGNKTSVVGASPLLSGV
jgi:hypothetical protein